VRDSIDVAADPAYERGYAEWFAWARQNLGADGLAAHEAAEAAMQALGAGQDTQGATAAASRAARGATRLAALNVAPRQRAYAEWYDWARVESGQPPERLHEAASAAVGAMEAGQGAAGAAESARATLGLEPRGEGGLHFWKPPTRVALLVMFCGIGPLLIAIPTLGVYWTWWNWQFFKFMNREALPKARSFLWTLIPGYGYFVIWQQLDGFGRAEAAVSGARGRSPRALAVLVVASALLNVVANRLSYTPLVFVVFLCASALLAVYAYLVQSRVNAFLAAVHPGAQAAPLTVGEVVAAVLGAGAFVLVLVGLFYTG
jgi:hypothetical protein